jgi:hypothetical protein
MLGFARRLLGVKLLFINVPYGGVIGEAPAGQELSRLLADFARCEGIARLRLVDSPSVAPTPAEGFQVTPDHTHLLFIKNQTYEEIWVGFPSAIRRNVRKAERHGLIVEEAQGIAAVEEFYPLYLEAMRRNYTVPKYGRAFITAVYQHLIVPGTGALFLARLAGQAIAGILVVDSPHMSHYVMGGSFTATLPSRPNDLLFHTAIKRTVEKGFAAFDFLPSGANDSALTHFKAKWNAQPTPAQTLTLVTRPIVMRGWNVAYWFADTAPGRWLLQKYQHKG